MGISPYPINVISKKRAVSHVDSNIRPLSCRNAAIRQEVHLIGYPPIQAPDACPGSTRERGRCFDKGAGLPHSPMGEPKGYRCEDEIEGVSQPSRRSMNVITLTVLHDRHFIQHLERNNGSKLSRNHLAYD